MCNDATVIPCKESEFISAVVYLVLNLGIPTALAAMRLLPDYPTPDQVRGMRLLFTDPSRYFSDGSTVCGDGADQSAPGEGSAG